MGCLLSVGVGLSESNVNLCYLVCTEKSTNNNKNCLGE